jgi:hypothetical protein
MRYDLFRGIDSLNKLQFSLTEAHFMPGVVPGAGTLELLASTISFVVQH